MLTSPEKPVICGGFAAESGAVAPLCQFGLALLAVLSFKIFLALQIGTGEFQAMLVHWSHSGIFPQMAAQLIALDTLSQLMVSALGQLQG